MSRLVYKPPPYIAERQKRVQSSDLKRTRILTEKKSCTTGVIWYCGKTAEWMQLDTISVQDQAGIRPVPVQDQAGLRPVAIWRTLVGSHTHGQRDLVLWQNG